GDRAATDRTFAEAGVTVKQEIYIPRIHVSSIETCGCVAHFDKVNDKLTVWMTTQAPHAIRTVFALVAGHVGLAEHKIRIISPDIGGGFGGKVPVYHGYVIAAANPSKFPAGLFHVCTGSYDLKAAHVEVDGVYTNKPPGGIAYRCSFRVTEAVHTIERMVDLMARELGMDAADFRMKNFIKPEQFPYKSALGWEYDSGNYGAALQKAMDRVGYAELK